MSKLWQNWIRSCTLELIQTQLYYFISPWALITNYCTVLCFRSPFLSCPHLPNPINWACCPLHIMPPKWKGTEEGNVPSDLQPRHHSCASKAPVPQPEVKPELCSAKILWDSNECWTDHLVDFFSNNLDIWFKMFSNSVKDARKESHKKVSHHDPPSQPHY